ncbi:AMSH-like ubiquitin thioesterase 2 isoform X2 [Gossypium australe]|uniref:AMSH-like ubiquitin thioesterase 2 isoform X2 n=1 Tax=Gossypium australe TaxID=47621 RepID=A0A5B6WNL9_9ROSI|nr:AMSH-like ubiquitin thioesterase 2 isoform X2 [Gossypium australe]
MTDDRFSQLPNNKYSQMYQFVDGRETLKSIVVQDSSSQKIYSPLNVGEKKERICGIPQTECQSLRIVIEERVGLASCNELDFVSSYRGRGSPCLVPDQATTTCKLFNVHAVTQSSPSTILSFTEKASQTSHVSRVVDSDQQSSNEPEASRVLQNVHISTRLMEDFLELAKENTKKDLETCGVLGAFLVRLTTSFFNIHSGNVILVVLFACCYASSEFGELDTTLLQLFIFLKYLSDTYSDMGVGM